MDAEPVKLDWRGEIVSGILRVVLGFNARKF